MGDDAVRLLARTPVAVAGGGHRQQHSAYVWGVRCEQCAGEQCWDSGDQEWNDDVVVAGEFEQHHDPGDRCAGGADERGTHAEQGVVTR